MRFGPHMYAVLPFHCAALVGRKSSFYTIDRSRRGAVRGFLPVACSNVPSRRVSRLRGKDESAGFLLDISWKKRKRDCRPNQFDNFFPSRATLSIRYPEYRIYRPDLWHSQACRCPHGGFQRITISSKLFVRLATLQSAALLQLSSATTARSRVNVGRR